MKTILKKIIICILIVLMINNFFMSNLSFADSGAAGDTLNDMLSTVVGMLTYPFRIIAVAFAYGIDVLVAGIAYSEGKIDASGNVVDAGAINTITPFDILFNKVALLDINFFDVSNGSGGTAATDIVNNIRVSIASWYYIMRTFACAILLVVLIYVGIRMAISTVASDKAMYKKNLVDWVCSLALIFLLQYIILFTVNVNNIFVNSLASMANDGNAITTMTEDIRKDAMKFVSGVTSIASTLVYCMIVAQTLGLLISYVNRMLKLAFLIIIAPLITLTYSIDKMGDGKAQALSAWLKEFVFSILIQPFHCVIYMSLISTSFSILTSGEAEVENSLAAAIIAMLCIKFTKDAEGIVRKIFSFENDDSSTSIGAGMALTAAALSQSRNIARGAKGVVNGARNLGTNIGQGFHNMKLNTMALGAMATAKKSGSSSGDKKSFSDYKEEAKESEEKKQQNKMNIKSANKAEKIAKKLEKKNKKYGVTTSNGEINKRAAEIRDKNPKLTAAQARSFARKSLAEEKSAVAAKKYKGKDKVIHGFKNMAGSVKDVTSNLETFKGMGSLMKKTVGAGVGLSIGGMVYGSTGNVINSVGAGVVGGKTTAELLTNTTHSLRSDARKRLESLGAGDANSAGAIANTALSNGKEYYNDQEKVKTMMKEIENALKALGKNPEDKKNIMNKIRKGVQENPGKSISQITKAALKDQIGLGGPKTGKEKDLMAKAANFATFEQEKAFVGTVETATSVGLNPNYFVESATKHVNNGEYNEYGNSSYGSTGKENAEEIDEKASYHRESIDELNKQMAATIDANEKAVLKEQIDAHEKEILKLVGAKTEGIIKEEQSKLQEQFESLQAQLDGMAERSEQMSKEKYNDLVKMQQDISSQASILSTMIEKGESGGRTYNVSKYINSSVKNQLSDFQNDVNNVEIPKNFK